MEIYCFSFITLTWGEPVVGNIKFRIKVRIELIAVPEGAS
jgi:hypothetical protein